YDERTKKRPQDAGVVWMRSGLSVDQLPQYKMENPAGLEVLDFIQGVDTAQDLERTSRPIVALHFDGKHLMRFDIFVQAANRKPLGSVQPQRLPVLAIDELQRQYPHADQIGAVDALETF